MTKVMKTEHISVTYATIASVIEQLNARKEIYPEIDVMSARLEIENDYEDSYVSCVYRRYETPDETDRRLRAEQVQREHQLEWKRKQFESLKKEFGE